MVNKYGGDDLFSIPQISGSDVCKRDSYVK